MSEKYKGDVLSLWIIQNLISAKLKLSRDQMKPQTLNRWPLAAFLSTKGGKPPAYSRDELVPGIPKIQPLSTCLYVLWQPWNHFRELHEVETMKSCGFRSTVSTLLNYSSSKMGSPNPVGTRDLAKQEMCFINRWETKFSSLEYCAAITFTRFVGT